MEDTSEFLGIAKIFDKIEVDELTNLARQVDLILKYELERNHIQADMAEARVYDVFSVGVMGDARTYEHPAEITLYYKENFIWDTEFLNKLSTTIVNNVRGINRVVCVTSIKR